MANDSTTAAAPEASQTLDIRDWLARYTGYTVSEYDAGQLIGFLQESGWVAPTAEGATDAAGRQVAATPRSTGTAPAARPPAEGASTPAGEARNETRVVATAYRLLPDLRAGKKMRPTNWRHSSMLFGGYCHLPDPNTFEQLTPRTVGSTTSPVMAGLMEAIRQSGHDWETVSDEDAARDAAIEITYVHPPIGVRTSDYQATLRSFDPEASSGPNSKVGRGATAREAADDLIAELAADDPQ